MDYQRRCWQGIFRALSFYKYKYLTFKFENGFVGLQPFSIYFVCKVYGLHFIVGGFTYYNCRSIFMYCIHLHNNEKSIIVETGSVTHRYISNTYVQAGKYAAETLTQSIKFSFKLLLCIYV